MSQRVSSDEDVSLVISCPAACQMPYFDSSSVLKARSCYCCCCYRSLRTSHLRSFDTTSSFSSVARPSPPCVVRHKHVLLWLLCTLDNLLINGVQSEDLLQLPQEVFHPSTQFSLLLLIIDRSKCYPDSLFSISLVLCLSLSRYLCTLVWSEARLVDRKLTGNKFPPPLVTRSSGRVTNLFSIQSNPATKHWTEELERIIVVEPKNEGINFHGEFIGCLEIKFSNWNCKLNFTFIAYSPIVN